MNDWRNNKHAQREHHYGPLQPMDDYSPQWQGPYWLWAIAAIILVIAAASSA